MTKLNISNVLKAVDAAKPNSLAVQRWSAIDDESAIALFSFSGRVTAAELASAVANAFDGKLAIGVGSAHTPNPAHPNLVQAFVRVNRAVRPYDDEGAKGLTAVTANVFRDEDDALWEKRGEGETAVIVKKTTDDLEAILASRQPRTIVTASINMSLSEHAYIGQGIGWYDPEADKMRFGVKIGQTDTKAPESVVFDLDTEVASVIPSAFIQLAAERSSVTIEVCNAYRAAFGPNAAPLTPSNFLHKHLSYMATLYADRKEYFSKLRSLMAMSYGRAALNNKA